MDKKEYIFKRYISKKLSFKPRYYNGYNLKTGRRVARLFTSFYPNR